MTACFARARTGVHAALIAAALVAGQSATAAAQDKDLLPIPLAGFAFPTMANTIADIIVAKEFDRKNGLKGEMKVFGTGGAMFAAWAKGELVVQGISVYHVQKMRAEGVPLTLAGTLVQLSSLQVITHDPSIRKFEDLKGKTFAATVAFAEYEYLSMLAKKLGFNLADDVKVVNATTALARAQLKANRADAIMAWEPGATLVMADHPDNRVLIDGNEAWKVVAGTPGWQLYLAIRTDYLDAHRGSAGKIVNMYRDAATFLNEHPDEADAIVTSGKYTTKGLPAGTIASGVKGGRLRYDVQPAWDPQINKYIWQALQIGVDYGYIPGLPDKAAVLSDNPS